MESAGMELCYHHFTKQPRSTILQRHMDSQLKHRSTHLPKWPLAHGATCWPPPFLFGALFCWDCIFILCSFIFANRESNVWGLCFATALTSCFCCYTRNKNLVTFFQNLPRSIPADLQDRQYHEGNAGPKNWWINGQKMGTPSVIQPLLQSSTRNQGFQWEEKENRGPS